MKILYIISLISTVFLTSCAENRSYKAQISWDEWGVPHITANNIEGLFYAQGWAQMHNHANLILELYGSSRGRGAEYWGENELQNDQLVHTLGFNELADKWEKEQDPETKKILESFVEGMNDYARKNPSAIDRKNKIVLPVTTKDVNMHSMYVVFTRFVAANEVNKSQRWDGSGSNAYAISPKRSASGNAMLVQNPHLPWSGEYLFFESHLMMNNKNLYGATLVGLPGILIGFNQFLGWTHTNNTIDNSDLYELLLKDGGYILDGKREDFDRYSKPIWIKKGNGKKTKTEISILKSVHGTVIKSLPDKALALRMTGLDRPNMLLQWWRMINSTNFDEFETSLKMAQIPFWNVLYADRDGNIFYLFNGLVPKRDHGDWRFWNSIIDGTQSANIWTEVHSYEDLPKIKNPETGWLQNANDPPWSSTIPMILKPEQFPAYMSPIEMRFRPQRAVKMILADTSLTFDELIDCKLSTRIEFAERILDDLQDAVEKYGSAKAKEAAIVLKNWDREANSDSKGTMLFQLWAEKFSKENSHFSQEWDFNNPFTTPDGLSDPERAAQLLDSSALEMEKKYGKLEVSWGEILRLRRNNVNLPGNGINESMGVFRVANSYDGDDGRKYVTSGDSWVGVIEFGDDINAKVLLSYGNASQSNSPHNGDQLSLFSKKELRDVLFTPEQVKSGATETVYFP